MLHCPSWPEMSNPQSIYDFIVDVHERCQDYRNGPIVVVDRYGGAQACTFCAISSLAIEMEYCNTANIYQYAKLYHNKRPGVWTSSEDIRLIYNILSFIPRNLQMLKRTALRTEFEDVTTATPDLYSKICSNGNVTNVSQINHLSSHNPNIITSIITNNTNNTNMNNIMTSKNDSNSNIAINNSSRNSSSSSTQSTVQLYNTTITSSTTTTTTTTPTITMTSQQQQQQFDDAHQLPRNITSSRSSSPHSSNTITTINISQNAPILTNNNIHHAANSNPMRIMNDTNSNINFTHHSNNAATSNITTSSSTTLTNNGMIMCEQQWQSQQQPLNYNDIGPDALPIDALPTNVGYLYLPPPPPEFNSSQTTSTTATTGNQLVNSLVTPPTTPTFLLNGELDPMGLNPLLGGGGNSSSPTSSASHGNGLLNAINNHLQHQQQQQHHHHLHHNNHQNNNNINNHNNSTNHTTNNNNPCISNAVTDPQSLDIVG